MAYKSVININKDKKKRQEILNNLRNSRQRSSYNSTSGAQGQAMAQTNRTEQAVDRRARVGQQTKGQSYSLKEGGLVNRGTTTKAYTYKKNDNADELARLRQQAAQEERGSYLTRSADDSSYASSTQGREQRQRIRSYENANNKYTVSVSNFNTEADDKKNESLKRDSSLNRYRGSLNATARQAERNNNDWNKWQQTLNGIRSESPEDYSAKVEKGRKMNPLRGTGSGVDSQTMEYLDFLYGSGYSSKANEGVKILQRSQKTQEDYKTKAQEYQNAALRSNQNIANNYTAEAKKTQQRIDDIKSGKVKVADKWGEINALNDKRAEYEQSAREYQTYADRDQNVTKNQLKMKQDPEAEAKIEAGRQQDTFLYSKDNADAYRIAQSMGGLDDNETLKTASMTMSEDERRQYYYTLAEDGEEAAQNYLRTLYNDTGDDTGGLSGRFTAAFNQVRDHARKNNAGVQTLNKVFDYAQTFGAGVTNATVGITDAARHIGGNEDVRLEGLTQKIYQDNVQKGRVNKVVGDIAFNIGNMVPAIGVSIATGGMGAAPMVAAIASASTTGVSSFGNTYQQARREGFASDEATGYALLNGISEAALQYALTGVGAMAGGFTTDALAQTARGAIGRTVSNPVARYALQTIVGQSINSIGEFTEEYLQEVLDPVFRNWALGEANEFDPFTEEALYAGLLGALSAGVMNSVSVVGETAQYTRNGRQISESIPDLITQGLSFAPTADVARTASYLQTKLDNGGTITDMEAGLLVQQTDEAAAVENEIRSYLSNETGWNTLSDKARATLVTPSNAEYLAIQYGLNVNESMSPDEMRSIVDAAAAEATANENRRSVDEFFDSLPEDAEDYRTLYKDSEKASGKEIIVADLGDRINGFATADRIVINSAIANTEQGARFVLAHELTHGTEMSRSYNSLLDSARKFFGDDWDTEVQRAIETYSGNNGEFSVEQAEREVVADFVGNKIFADLDSMRNFIRDHKTTARRILTWLKNKFTNASGTDNTALREAYNNFERAFNEIDRSTEGRRASLQYQQRLANAPQYSLAEEAVVHFGETSRWSETGYLTPDGTKLDFSGRHEGNTRSGVRAVDHRQVSEIMEDGTEGTDAMIDFMAEGNIRISPETGGINLSVMPTDKQIRALADFIRNNDGEVMLDVDDTNGRTMFSKDYDMGTNPSTVINDIREYFNENTAPADALYTNTEQKSGKQYSISPEENTETAEPTEEKSEARQVLDNAAEAYGTIKPGENPVREANMPKKTSENRFVSKYARTLYEAGATTDAMIPVLDSGIAAEDFSYERIANAKLQKGAETIIKTDGIESARRQWDGVAERSDAATPQDIALGQYLYNEYVKAGDYDNAIQVAIDLAHKATTAGQTVQAFRLLKKLTPDGQLYTLEKLANDYTKQLSKRNIKGFNGIEIDEGLAKQLLEAKSKEEIQTARQAIMQNIADQVPATWADKLNAWRYMAMLFNPRTHIRNVVGNAFFVPMRGLKDLIGAGMESAMQRSGKMQQTERTKTVVNPYDKANKALFDKAKESFDENVDIIRGEDKYGKSDIDQKRRIFKSRVLNWIDKFNSAMLEKEDVIFMKKAYVDSYAKAMRARGLTPETMTPAQENDIASYAIKEAQKATYRDANALASALNKFKRSNKFAHILGEGLFPFTKTPLNILKRGVEYSPLGIIKGTYQMLNGVRKGNVTAAEAIDSMASGISGSGILAIGAFLASQGLIKGGQGDDDEAALDSLQGGQSYALVIGDKSYTLDWAAPVAMPLFIGVEMFNSFDKDNEGGANFSRIVDSITKISDPLFNLSMLSSLNSAIDTIKYNEGSSALTEIGINVVTSYAGQFVPTISGQFARIIDPTQRKTFYGKDSNLPKAVDSLWQGAVKKIPGLSMIMQPSVDRWGREKKTENITERVLENLASPGYYSERSGDDVDKEVDRLYVQVGDAGVIPPAAEKSIKWSNSETKEKGEINLTAEQYTKYSKRLGELCYNGVQDLIKSDAYKDLNDRERADAIAEIYDYAKNIAKNEITDGKYELKKWTQVLKDNQDVLGDYAVYKTKISGSDMDTKEKRTLLRGMKMGDDVKEQIYRASFSDSDIENLDQAEKGGASFNQFLTVRVGMDKIDDSNSKTKSLDKKELLLDKVKDEKAMGALWETFFETENTHEDKTLAYAVKNGVKTEDFIKSSVEFGKIDNIDVKEGQHSRTVQKKEWLAKNVKDEKALETLYTMKLEDSGTDEDKTIAYAVKHGVKASSFVKREIQKADEHGDKSGETKANYYIENGVITYDEKDKYISGSKLVKSAHNLLNSGYSDKEIEYFYQKEYSSDDDFVWMVGAGLTPKQYIEYLENTALITADKDENGKTVNGSKKIKMFNAINSMKLTKLQKMLLFMTDYKMTKDQYRAIFQYINSLSMSRDEKLALAAGLGFTVENGRVLL